MPRRPTYGIVVLLLLLIAAGVVWFVWGRGQYQGAEGFQDRDREVYLLGSRALFHEQLTPLGVHRSLNDVRLNGKCPDGLTPCGEENKGCCDNKQRAMLISPGISVDSINDVLYTPDAKPSVKDARNLFQPLNTSYIELDQGFCRQAVHPRNLRSRAAGEALGCGWWFVETSTVPSTAALGTPSGPLDSRVAEQRPEGRWIWDLAEAAKAEDIKRCKRIRTCAYITAENIRGECGFCPEKGHAVPIDSAGNPKYTNVGEGVCRSVITDPSQCPRPLRQPARDSADNFVFDPATGMLVTRVVGEEGADPVAIDRICDPDANGRLSVACLTSLAKSAGCTDRGALLQRLTGMRGGIAVADETTLTILQSVGFQMPAGLLSDVGSLSLQVAADALSRLSGLTVGGGSERVRNAAVYWVLDMAAIGEVDACPYGVDDTGPFPLACLQREFRQAGCQPSGAAFPKAADTFAGKTMGAIRDAFRRLYAGMASKDPRDQAEAMKACLGIGFQQDPSTLVEVNACAEPGVDVFVYHRETLLFHRILKSATLDLSLADKQAIQHIAPTGSLLRIVYRTYVVMNTDTTLTLQIPKEGARVRLDGAVVPTTVVGTWSVPVKAGKRHALVIEVPAASATEAVAPLLPLLADAPQVFQLHQASDRPLVSLDFFKPTVTANPKPLDTNDLVPLRTNASRMIYENVSGILVNQSEVEGGLGFALSLLKTLTWRIRFQRLAAEQNLLTFANPRGDRLSVDLLVDTSGAAHVRTTVQTGGSVLRVITAPKQLDEDVWYHFAVLLNLTGDLSQSVRVYVQGVELARDAEKTQVPALGLEPVVFTRMMIPPGLYAAIAWIHIYDRLLVGDADIERDRYFDDPAKAMAIQSALASEAMKKMVYPSETFGNPLYGVDVTQGAYKMADMSGATFEVVQTTCIKDGCAAIVYDSDANKYYGIRDKPGLVLDTEKKSAKVTSWVRMDYTPMYGKKLSGRPLMTYTGVKNAEVCGKLCKTIRDDLNEGPICGGFFFDATKRQGTCQLFRHVNEDEETRHDANRTTYVSGIMSYNTLGKDKGEDAYNEKLKRGLRFDEPQCRESYYEYGLPDMKHVKGVSAETIVAGLEEPRYTYVASRTLFGDAQVSRNARDVSDPVSKCCPVRPSGDYKTCDLKSQPFFSGRRQYSIQTNVGNEYNTAEPNLVITQDGKNPDTSAMYSTLDLAVAACTKQADCKGVFTNTSTGNYYTSSGSPTADTTQFSEWVGWTKRGVTATPTAAGTVSLPEKPPTAPTSVNVSALNAKLRALPPTSVQQYDLTFGDDVTPAQRWRVF